MRIHSQSNTKYNGREDSDVLTEGLRVRHDAMSVACPYCGAKAGARCISEGKFMHALSVHQARQDASL